MKFFHIFNRRPQAERILDLFVNHFNWRQLIKQRIPFFLLGSNECKKGVAGVFFVLAFVLFLFEISDLVRPVEVVSKAETFIEHPKRMTITKQSPLFKASLFGQYVPENLADESVKQSMLDMEVTGVLFSNSDKESQVIIRINGGEQQSYRVDDLLPDGVVIKRISERGVLIVHHGVLESLSLPKNELVFASPAKPLIEE